MKKFLVLLLIAVTAWYAFCGQNIVRRAMEGKSYTEGLKPIKTPEVLELLEKSRGRPLLVHVYSSACIICRLYFSDIVDIAADYKDLSVMVVSVDKYPLLLATFLQGRNLPFAPYWFEGTDDELAAALKSAGVHYQDNEPYTAVIDANRQIHEFGTGPGFAGRIRAYLSPFEKK